MKGWVTLMVMMIMMTCRGDLELNVGSKQRWALVFLTITKFWLCQRRGNRKADGENCTGSSWPWTLLKTVNCLRAWIYKYDYFRSLTRSVETCLTASSWTEHKHLFWCYVQFIQLHEICHTKEAKTE